MKLLKMLLSWMFVVCLWCILVVSSQGPIVAQTHDGWICGPVTCPFNITLMCFVTERSSDNETKVTRCGTCLSRNGDIIKEATRIDNNTGRNRTDIISISVIDLDIPNANEIRDTMMAVLRGTMARKAGSNASYIQVTTPSTALNQMSTVPGIQPVSQIIIVQPPAPQYVFNDGRMEYDPRGYYGPMPQPNPPPQQNQNYPNVGPKYQLPNVQPTILAEINKCLIDIEQKHRRLRDLIRDASAGLGTPYLDQNRVFRPAFPVLVPPASFR